MVDVKDIAHRSASEIKQLSEIAKQFIIELNGEQDRFQIEEVGLSDDGKKWFVTLSYLQKIEKPNQLQKTLGLANRRVYKRLSINKKELNVVAMSDWTGQMLQPA
jgi:hypothetical protein